MSRPCAVSPPGGVVTDQSDDQARVAAGNLNAPSAAEDTRPEPTLAHETLGFFKSQTFAAIFGVVFSTFVLGPIGFQARLTDVAARIGWTVQHGLHSKPTCADTGFYHSRQPINSNANYTYSQPGVQFRSVNTYDGSRLTAWVEYGWPHANQNEDAISWDFKKSSSIKLICVTNGYANSVHSYEDTGMLKIIRVNGCGATPIVRQLKRLSDKTSNDWEYPQDVALSCTTKSISFVIADRFPAQDKKNVDQVGISEIQFFG